MSDNLPRPDVLDGSPLPPGPWALGPDLDVLDAHGYLILRAESDPGGIGVLGTIACLPEIIDERDALARRMDAVRALCAEMPRRMHANTSQESARFRGACDFATEVLALLDGDGEDGDGWQIKEQALLRAERAGS